MGLTRGPEVRLMRDRTMNVDLKEQHLADVSIGDTVKVLVTGTVTRLSAGEKPTKKEKKDGWEGYPPDMTVKVESTEVQVESENQFEKLAEEEL